jgi:hypothetical protein
MDICPALYKIAENAKCKNIKLGFYCNWICAWWSRMPTPMAISVLPVKLGFCFIFYICIGELE